MKQEEPSQKMFTIGRTCNWNLWSEVGAEMAGQVTMVGTMNKEMVATTTIKGSR